MVEHMRATIEALGGEIRFSSRVDDMLVEIDGPACAVRGVTLSNGEQLRADHVVMALGHSARDTFEMLHERGVYLEAKPFSVGFRIEHPQSLIDARGSGAGRAPLLGAADYKLVHHCRNGRSVYSFCMCPGGTVVAAAIEPGRVVTNGMSQYSRNERNANAGDRGRDHAGGLPGVRPTASRSAGVALQRHWESSAFVLGGGDYEAPGQLVGDFLRARRRANSARAAVVHAGRAPGRPRRSAAGLCHRGDPRGVAGVRPADQGFAMPDAVLTGVETRTSSPMRITRGDDGQSLNTRGLFPAGEGAGYAGGILSAGVDGIKTAEAVAMSILAGMSRTSGNA